MTRRQDEIFCWRQRITSSEWYTYLSEFVMLPFLLAGTVIWIALFSNLGMFACYAPCTAVFLVAVVISLVKGGSKK